MLTKTRIFSFIIPLAFIKTVHCMNLSKPYNSLLIKTILNKNLCNNQTKIISGCLKILPKMCIGNYIRTPITYNPNSETNTITSDELTTYITAYTTHNKIELNTPFVNTIIFNEKTNQYVKTEDNKYLILQIPSPDLLKCDNGSELCIKTEQYTFNVICTQNDNMTFQEELIQDLDDFAHNPQETVFDKQIKEILINNNIITETDEMTRPYMKDSTGNLEQHLYFLYKQGANGYKGEKDLLNLTPGLPKKITRQLNEYNHLKK